MLNEILSLAFIKTKVLAVLTEFYLNPTAVQRRSGAQDVTGRKDEGPERQGRAVEEQRQRSSQ